MSAVASWLMSILGITIVGTLVDLIVPAGRMGKFLKSVFAALTVLIIVLPLPGFIKNGFNPDSGFLVEPEFTLDESYLAKADEIRFRYLAGGVESQLAADGIKGVRVEIKGRFDGATPNIVSVLINIENLVIDSVKPHINKNEYIAETVAGYLNIHRGLITVYG